MKAYRCERALTKKLPSFVGLVRFSEVWTTSALTVLAFSVQSLFPVTEKASFHKRFVSFRQLLRRNRTNSTSHGEQGKTAANVLLCDARFQLVVEGHLNAWAIKVFNEGGSCSVVMGRLSTVKHPATHQSPPKKGESSTSQQTPTLVIKPEPVP